MGRSLLQTEMVLAINLFCNNDPPYSCQKNQNGTGNPRYRQLRRWFCSFTIDIEPLPNRLQWNECTYSLLYHEIPKLIYQFTYLRFNIKIKLLMDIGILGGLGILKKKTADLFFQILISFTFALSENCMFYFVNFVCFRCLSQPQLQHQNAPASAGIWWLRLCNWTDKVLFQANKSV